MPTLISLVTLSAMEIVLGIDNIIFLSILAGKLPREQQGKARKLGLLMALVMRIGLLFALSWLTRLTAPLFTVFMHAFSGRDLILLGGGLFLIAKAAHEIYDKLEVEHPEKEARARASSLMPVLLQIMAMDAIFSLDSVITAIGMVDPRQVWIMIAAMVIAVAFMLFFSSSISDFVNRHPSMKVLALSFLLLIGVLLVADGMGRHIEKGYVYFAMAFSVFVELLNMRLRKRQKPVVLHSPLESSPDTKVAV